VFYTGGHTKGIIDAISCLLRVRILDQKSLAPCCSVNCDASRLCLRWECGSHASRAVCHRVGRKSSTVLRTCPVFPNSLASLSLLIRITLTLRRVTQISFASFALWLLPSSSAWQLCLSLGISNRPSDSTTRRHTDYTGFRRQPTLL
jgi:hypothetical protein